MIFHDSTQKRFFSKHKNKAEFKCLDDSEVLSSDFPGLKTSAASMTSVASTTSMASMTSKPQKYYFDKLNIVIININNLKVKQILFYFNGNEESKQRPPSNVSFAPKQCS